jgi:hypothetical protein
MTKITNVIMIKYDTNQGQKIGQIKLNFRYIYEDNKIDCLGVEFSDLDTQQCVGNTSLLFDLQSKLMNRLKREYNSEFELRMLNK